jgi:hypothetical protein
MTDKGRPRQGFIRVDRLRQAAWLQLNDCELADRELLADGKLAYYFAECAETTVLLAAWNPHEPEIARLCKFAQLVSKEIGVAVAQRRNAGMRYDKLQKRYRFPEFTSDISGEERRRS